MPAQLVSSHWKKLLARTYAFVGKLDEAEAAYEAATALTPLDVAGFSNLGTCRVQQGMCFASRKWVAPAAPACPLAAAGAVNAAGGRDTTPAC